MPCSKCFAFTAWGYGSMSDPITVVGIKTTLRSSLAFWKRFQSLWRQVEAFAEAQAHIADLQKRIAVLEQRLAPCPGEGCPRCGDLTWRAASSEPAGFGEYTRYMKCDHCGLEEKWPFDPRTIKHR
jgi:hypothetical protein